MRLITLTPIIFLLLAPYCCQAQNQLVLVNREKILARYSEGQTFTYRLKKSKYFAINDIVKVQEFSVITSYDTIPFSEIDKIRWESHHTTFLNRLGKMILYSGIAYFVIDQFNSMVIHGQGFDHDKAVWIPALILISTGTILKLIHKQSQRMRYPAKLLAVGEGSPFYKSDR